MQRLSIEDVLNSQVFHRDRRLIRRFTVRPIYNNTRYTNKK